MIFLSQWLPLRWWVFKTIEAIIVIMKQECSHGDGYVLLVLIGSGHGWCRNGLVSHWDRGEAVELGAKFQPSRT